MRRALSMRNLAAFAAAASFAVGAVLFNLGFTPGWLILFGAVAAAFWVVDVLRARQHRSEYADFALLHGWDYAPRSFDFNTRFATAPFGVGSKMHQTDVLRGTLNGLECATFTHHYQTGHGEPGETTEYMFQVSLAELPVNLPLLDLIPESLAQRAAKTMGAMDIEFESYEFNRRWRVRANDRRYAHDLLDPRMLERLTQPDAQGAVIRIEGGAVMTWQAGRVGLDGLATRLGVLSAIARRIPDHVLRDHTERGFGSQRDKYSGTEDRHRPLKGPDWAVTPGALTSGRYTGLGADPADDGRQAGQVPEP